MQNKQLHVFVTVALVNLAFIGGASAQIPEFVLYDGTLDQGGTVFTGTADLTFSLFDDPFEAAY